MQTHEPSPAVSNTLTGAEPPAQPRSGAWPWLQSVLDAAKGLPAPLLFVILLLVLVIAAAVMWSVVDRLTPLHWLLAALVSFLVIGGFAAALWLEARRHPPADPPAPPRRL